MHTTTARPPRRSPVIDRRRERAFRLFDRGASAATVQQMLNIGRSTAYSYLELWRRQQALRGSA